MTKQYLMHKDSSGAYDKIYPVIDFTSTDKVVIDTDTPFIVLLLLDNTAPLLLKLTYISNGFISYGNESGCMAWIKVKDKSTDIDYKRVSLSPNCITLNPGSVLRIEGARVFDRDFTVQIETFEMQTNYIS